MLCKRIQRGCAAYHASEEGKGYYSKYKRMLVCRDKLTWEKPETLDIAKAASIAKVFLVDFHAHSWAKESHLKIALQGSRMI